MHFQQIKKEILKGLPFASGYLDNILIFSENIERNSEHLGAVFDRVGMTGLKMKIMKYDLLKCDLHYLGHLISGKGIYHLPEKLHQRPSCAKDI